MKASSSSPVPTTGGGFDAVVAMLEKQKAVIESALSALRQLEDGATIPGPGSVATATKKKRKGGMTPEGKKRLIAALKQRWAAKKAPAKKSQG